MRAPCCGLHCFIYAHAYPKHKTYQIASLQYDATRITETTHTITVYENTNVTHGKTKKTLQCRNYAKHKGKDTITKHMSPQRTRHIQNYNTHINTLNPTYPIQKDTNTRHITYTKQIIRNIKQYIHAKAQTIQRCKQNQKHVKQWNMYKHQRENNACLMSAHKYYDRGLSVYKNRASTIKSKCFNRSNKCAT